MFLVTHVLGNFSFAVTYDLFITLGLITSVPVSAGKIFLNNFMLPIASRIENTFIIM